jgi:hypothetical protein
VADVLAASRIQDAHAEAPAGTGFKRLQGIRRIATVGGTPADLKTRGCNYGCQNAATGDHQVRVALIR